MLGKHGHIGLETVALTTIDLEGPPPLGRITAYDACELKIPGVLVWEFELGAKVLIFLLNMAKAMNLHTKKLVGVLELGKFAQQNLARNGAVYYSISRRLDATAEGKEGAKEGAHCRLYTPGTSRREVEQHRSQCQHQ